MNVGKKLYQHTIEFINASTKLSLYFNIINNSNELLDSFTKVVDYITSFSELKLYPCIGNITVGSNYNVAFLLFKRVNENKINLNYLDSTGFHTIDNITLTNYYAVCTDRIIELN